MEAAGRPDFTETWRRVEPEVRRSLSSAPRDVVEDVVQETGIKLLRAWPSIDHTRPVAPFAVTVARNCLRDELRKLSRQAAAELPEDIEVRDDLHTQVSARLELERVTSLLPRLTPGQRAALLGEVEGARVGAEAPRAKMMRSRARRRLRELLAQAGGYVTTQVARIRGAGGGAGGRFAADLGLVLQAALLAAIAGGAIDLPDPARNGRHSIVAAAPSASSAPRAAHHSAMDSPAATPAALSSRTSPAFTRAVAALPPEHGGNDGGPGIVPHIQPPHSKGRASDGGSFGAEGYDQAGSGSTTIAGHDVGWEYEQQWESPGCVQRLAEGETPGTCEVSDTPSGYVEAEVDGRRHRVDVPGGRGRK